MRFLRVNDILKDKILVSREAARLLEDPLRTLMGGANSSEQASPTEANQVTIDFRDVEGVAPSFLDELLTIFESVLEQDANAKERRLIVANPPTRLSLKFEAVARGHGMSVHALADASWMLTGKGNS